MQLEQGFFPDIPNNVYHNDIKAISSSQLVVAAMQTLAHFYDISHFNPKRAITEKTSAMTFGSASHVKTLERSAFDSEYIIKPDKDDYDDLLSTAPELRQFCKDNAIKQRAGATIVELTAAIKENLNTYPTLWNDVLDKFKGQINGREIISAKDGVKLQAQLAAFDSTVMVDSGGQTFLLTDAIKQASCEESFVWQDEDTGLWLKCRTDIRLGTMIFDYKTSVSASESKFSSDCGKLGYDIRAAMYLDGISKVLGIEHDNFTFIVQEKTSPYAVQCYRLTNYDLAIAQDVYKELLRQIKCCLDNDSWPAYGNTVKEIKMPDYIADQRQVRIFEREIQ